MAKIPPILKHATIAIFRGGSVKAPVRERFRRSFDIAVSQLSKYGYITGGGVNFEVTPKGKARNHQAEGARGFFKDRMFDAMFVALIREKTSGKDAKLSPDERVPDRIDAHVLGNTGFPKEAPHAGEPLWSHWKQPAKKK